MTRNAIIIALFLIVGAAGACRSPLDVDTYRRVTLVNIDSVITTAGFIGAPGDSISAQVHGEQVVFATEVLRPAFHNGVRNAGYYFTVQATRYGLAGQDYEVMSLRMDNVRDTGTYAINAAYSAPKGIDSNEAPRYGASYSRKMGGFPELFQTGVNRSSGVLHIARIDRERGVLVGTFAFTGYSTEADTVIQVDRGVFRLQLQP
ncbi:MAG: hypothetical protein JWQ98_1972 [Chlorobi bacterium]|nr:hypothetical protein [Chlorobiota bacterium]